MGQAQINVRTRACSGTFIARTKQAALTHNVRGKELIKDEDGDGDQIKYFYLTSLLQRKTLAQGEYYRHK